MAIDPSQMCPRISTKGGSRRLEKSHKVWLILMMWAGAAEREREHEQPKLALKS